MLWFFDHRDATLIIETRYDNDTSEFVATVRYPNDREHIERFSDSEEFRRWLKAFEQTLGRQHWIARGGPIILPYGWPDKRLT
jgi:hypothetical protein